MSRELAAVVLAAGLGTRLRPLTRLRPKPLCPVGNVPLVDRALAHTAALGLRGPAQVAVNASWLADQVAAHVDGRAHLSVEAGRPLGTAGALGRLREWVDGRALVVINADAYLAGMLADLLAGWDGTHVRLLGVPADRGEVGTFAGQRFAGVSVLPWRWVRDLPPEPAELVTTVWRPAEAAGRLRVTPFDGFFRDTGTPAGYLAANVHAAAAAGGVLIAPDAEVTGRCRQACVGPGAVVHGDLTRAVVWPGGRVDRGEHLVDTIRTHSADHEVRVMIAARS